MDGTLTSRRMTNESNETDSNNTTASPLSRLRPGDLFAFSGRGFWSRMIRLRTTSRMTHVGFAFRLQNRLAVIEARERRGVRLFPLERYLEQNVTIHWYQLLDEDYGIDRTTLVNEALTHWGKRYAGAFQFLRSFGFLTRRMCDWLGLPHDTNPERFFCSEFVQHCLAVAGYAGNMLPPALTSPGDVVLLPCFRRRGRLEHNGRLIV